MSPCCCRFGQELHAATRDVERMRDGFKPKQRYGMEVEGSDAPEESGP